MQQRRHKTNQLEVGSTRDKELFGLFGEAIAWLGNPELRTANMQVNSNETGRLEVDQSRTLNPIAMEEPQQASAGGPCLFTWTVAYSPPSARFDGSHWPCDFIPRVGC